jgi:ectoine hydroxylase-related dioxygenase (phytanoyl-CoA dioxygenase family)
VPVTTAAEDVLATLDAYGYAVVEGALSPDEVAAVRAGLQPLLDETPIGRNDFEGFHTRRIYGVPGKTRCVDPLLLHPLALDVADRLLGQHQLCAAVVIDIGPGEVAQAEHHDDGLYPMPRPLPSEVLLSTMWALDDFTADNGATVMLPGSHRWPPRAPRPDDERVPAVMPAGSVAFYLGSTWHGGGANRSDARRLGITIEYVQTWLRTQESYTISTPWDEVRQLPERLQELLGWNIRPPFMGYAAGRHPKRFL